MISKAEVSSALADRFGAAVVKMIPGSDKVVFLPNGQEGEIQHSSLRRGTVSVIVFESQSVKEFRGSEVKFSDPKASSDQPPLLKEPTWRV